MTATSNSLRVALWATAFGAALVACGSSDGSTGQEPTAGDSGGTGGGGATATGGAANAGGHGSGGTSTTASGGAPVPGGGGNNVASGGSPGATGGGGTSSGATGGAASATGGVANGTGGTTTTPPPSTTARLFFLDIGGGRVLSARPDGTDVRVLVRGASSLPDGVAVDVAGKHVFWTNMGLPDGNDGFIDRTDLDGNGETVPVAPGQTFTPKQLKLDAANGKLYWSDREGMRLLRANLDGTALETLVETGTGDAARRDASNWCVGIALDVPGKKIYWTQKGGDNAGVGSIRRAGIDLPAGQDAAHRTDIEVLFDKLPEPIDLDVDLKARLVYWTDRGNPPKGNSVSRAPMDPPSAAAVRTDPQLLTTGLAEGIGITLDVPHGTMYFTDLGGTVYVSNLDGTAKRKLLSGQGSLTGIAYVELPP
jgi:hypothetical protein